MQTMPDSPSSRATRYPPEVKERALALYQGGLGCKLIARELGMTYHAVAVWARQSGRLRTRQEAGALKAERHPLQWGPLNAKRAWVLGLIYGNGGIRADGLSISLDAENCDVDVLLKARAILGHGSEPMPRGGDHRICFSSQRFVADLKRDFGLDENKGLSMPWPAVSQELLPHFVRGLLDTDGCWHSHSDRRSGLLVFSYSSSSRLFVERLEGSIFSNVNVCSRQVEHCPARKRQLNGRTITGRQQFRLEYAHFDSIELGRWLYAESTEQTRGSRKHGYWTQRVDRPMKEYVAIRHERHRAKSRANRIAIDSVAEVL